MFTFFVIAVGVVVIWRILAAARRQSAFESRFGPGHAPPTHTHDQGFSHLHPTQHSGWIAGGVESTTGGTSHDSAGGSWGGGGYDAPSSGGFDSPSASDSSSSGGFDSSSSSSGFDSGSSGGGDYGGGGGGGSWS